MRDLYERFAYDYDEFGPIEEYLGDEKTFLNKIFSEHGVRMYWTVPAEQGSTY